MEPATIAAPKQEALWGPIIREHNHRVVLSLLAMGVPLDRAQELAQRTWTKLIEKRRVGALERMEFPGLALKQARFFALDELRKRSADHSRFDELEAQTIRDERADPEDQLLKREELTSALRAVRRCSPSAQRVFRAVYEDPTVPHAQIAESLGLSVQRVRQVLCEVRKEIRSALEADR